MGGGLGWKDVIKKDLKDRETSCEGLRGRL